MLPTLCVSLHAQVPRLLGKLPAALKIERAAVSAALNRTTVHSVLPLLKTIPADAPIPAEHPVPPSIRSTVFTVQSTPQSKHKGSAFAVNIDGHVWGVTARHVMDDIGHTPFMTFPGPDGKDVILPAVPSKEGSAAGADVALFEIPPQALEYLVPLELAEDLPGVYSTLSSFGFAHGNFLAQPVRKVLFASDYRILTEYVSFNSQGNGYCGSPLLLDGKVAGVHIGSLSAQKHSSASWFANTLGTFNAPVHDLSIAVPAHWLRQLAQQAQGNAAQGTALVFNGLEISRLLPGEHIRFIMQLRDGKRLWELPLYPFMDYSHLENFFDVRPGDVFRMEVSKTNPNLPGRRTVWYEWDMQGNIKETIRK